MFYVRYLALSPHCATVVITDRTSPFMTVNSRSTRPGLKLRKQKLTHHLSKSLFKGIISVQILWLLAHHHVFPNSWFSFTKMIFFEEWSNSFLYNGSELGLELSSCKMTRRHYSFPSAKLSWLWKTLNIAHKCMEGPFLWDFYGSFSLLVKVVKLIGWNLD